MSSFEHEQLKVDVKVEGEDFLKNIQLAPLAVHHVKSQQPASSDNRLRHESNGTTRDAAALRLVRTRRKGRFLCIESCDFEFARIKGQLENPCIQVQGPFL
jgi:hypothetical protein